MDVESGTERHSERAARHDAIRRILDERQRDVVTHIRAVAQAVPDRLAVAYLERGEELGATMDFADMDRRARSLGALFQSRGAQGSRAVLLFDAGVAAVHALLGCVYGRVIATPLPAPSSSKPDRYVVRVKNIILDSQARFVVTTSGIKRRLQKVTAEMEGFDRVEWIEVDQLSDRSAEWVYEPVEETELTYLQYTSGSTSRPKGVMITHRNMMTEVAYMGKASGYLEYGTGMLCWMPYFHDFCLIDGLMVPLCHGTSVYLMSPFDFVRQPSRWVKAIDRYRISHSAGPSFSFDLVARKTTAEERVGLDLSCWKRATNAGEPIRSANVARFFEAFGPHGFAAEAMVPAYGLAETTLLVTMTERGVVYYPIASDLLRVNEARIVRDGARLLAGCGRVWEGPWRVEVRIVDPKTRTELPEGSVGEVWVCGDLVAAGYWNRPEETAEKFHARICSGDDTCYLRTGDLGFLINRELVITGRLKDLIIVDGRNHYPQDIEASAERSHACLRPGCSIAFAVEGEERTHVILVCEVGKGYCLSDDVAAVAAGNIVVSRSELERGIRREVFEEHQLGIQDIVLLTPGLLPKTTSGKVERSGCKARYLEGTLLNGVPRL